MAWTICRNQLILMMIEPVNDFRYAVPIRRNIIEISVLVTNFFDFVVIWLKRKNFCSLLKIKIKIKFYRNI